jgi:hypothetical protein
MGAQHKENFSDSKADVETPDPRTLKLPSYRAAPGQEATVAGRVAIGGR